ncbi:MULTISPECIES: hypothetical protein [unclassified Microcoleus]|uniref:hypothetical protein n=1 Tax=unclassified Microcoleus TaxID=2642155 RepID=UPI002FD19438
MSVLQQDLTASEQEMSKAIAQAWLSGVPEGTMIGEMRLPAKPDNLMDAQISDFIEGGTEVGPGIIPASCC